MAPAVAQEAGERLLHMADGVAQSLRAAPSSLNKSPATNRTSTFSGGAIAGHPLDGSAAKVIGAILTAETVAEVPVGGVQDAHAVDSSAPAAPVSCHLLSHMAGRCRKVSSEQLEYPLS